MTKFWGWVHVLLQTSLKSPKLHEIWSFDSQ